MISLEDVIPVCDGRLPERGLHLLLFVSYEGQVDGSEAVQVVEVGSALARDVRIGRVEGLVALVVLGRRRLAPRVAVDGVGVETCDLRREVLPAQEK